SDKETNLQFLSGYQPHNKDLKQQRILIYGPAGSGKSSFINSVDSVLQGRVTDRAAADAISGDSFTIEYKTYKIQKGSPGTFYPFSFTDIMGIEKDTEKGARVEDIKLAMKGHIKDGYHFNPVSKIAEDDRKYDKSPTLSDRVHVLVCVVSATTTNILSDETVAKMREVRLAARDMGIPQLAILTKIDEACPEVKANIRNAYKSKRLKEKMEELNLALGIPLKSIFLVKSYHSEINTDADMDTLILSALKQIIHFGEDFVNSLNTENLKFIKKYKPHNKDLKQQRILIYGPAGSGKSSFINSVDSVLQGRVTGRAAEDAISRESFTKEFRTYKILKGTRRTFYPFSFTDIMGIEKDTDKGARVEDIKLAMRGHIKDGYKFNPFSQISEDDHKYNKIPTLSDRVHVLVCVVSAATTDILSAETVAKMREVRLAARDMGIPQLAILTKIDEACPEVEANLKNAYKSMYLKETMEELNVALGIPPKSIFPVKSYHSEINTDADMDTLLLSALRQIIHFGEDFVNNL
ncbi:Interferon-induced protein 44, partial [Nibea albiflora]